MRGDWGVLILCSLRDVSKRREEGEEDEKLVLGGGGGGGGGRRSNCDLRGWMNKGRKPFYERWERRRRRRSTRHTSSSCSVIHLLYQSSA